MLLIASALLFAAFQDGPPGEDTAHRADRLRTQQLNRAARAQAEQRDRNAGDAHDQAYAAALRRYERERAAWRRRFDACQAGDWSACE